MIRTVHLAIAGPKGFGFCRKLVEQGLQIDRVISYPQKADPSDAYGSLTALCSEYGIELETDARFTPDPEALIFFVGWQYLVRGEHENLVVFHDSILPRHRGFNPTVNALIAGDTEIGVTGFRPDGGVDTGPVIAIRSAPVSPFTRIAEAIDVQTSLMVEMTADIAARWRSGEAIEAVEQDDHGATYSLWRDSDDYRLDFSNSAEQLLRHIRAVGPPYAGARAHMGQEEVVIHDAELVPDLYFPLRTPGKVWALEDGAPVVVCGEGLLKITDMRSPEGEPVTARRLRVRFS